MNQKLTILLLLSATLLFGCDRIAIPKASCVRAQFTWDGATAETIAEQLPGIASSFQVAVVEDGLATVYFDGEIEAVEAELQSSLRNSPAKLTIRSVETLVTGIPPLPEQTDVPRVRFEADRERMLRLSVTMADLASAIDGSTDSPFALADPDTFPSLVVITNDGKKIPILELGSVEIVKRQRPLLLHWGAKP